MFDKMEAPAIDPAAHRSSPAADVDQNDNNVEVTRITLHTCGHIYTNAFRTQY